MAIKKTNSASAKVVSEAKVKKTVAKKAVKTPAKAAKTTLKKVATKNVPAKVTKKVASKTTTGKAAQAKKVEKAKENPSKKLIDAIVDGILEIKGKNISILDLSTINNRVCDYYVICQADSSTQVNAIADSIEEIVKKTTGERPYHSEGQQNSEWILIDYVTVVVHVFQSHIREFYNLEALWADAAVTEIAFD